MNWFLNYTSVIHIDTLYQQNYRNHGNWWLTLLVYNDIPLVLTHLWRHSETNLYRNHGKRWLRCCRLVTFTLTEGIVRIDSYSMVQSPSWEANWFAASQEIPRISRNPKVHYRTHKCPPPAPILGQPNPVHIPTSHLLEIHPNIIHPPTPRSP